MNLIKTLRAEAARIETGNRQVRQFGWLVFAVLTVAVPAYDWWVASGDPSYNFGVSLLGPAVLLLSYVWPAVVRPAYRFWMILGLVLGLIFGNLVVAVVFYAVITPIGLINRISGKGFMPTGPDPSAPTYWKTRDQAFSRKDFERQF